MGPVDYYSTSASFLSLSFNDVPLAHGTGFFYFYKQRMFFVTARHNLTGVHWETGKNLHSRGGRPNQLTVHSWIHAEREEQHFVGAGHHKFALYDDGTPVWMEDTAVKRNADIAVIDLAKIARISSLFPDCDDLEQLQEWFVYERNFRDSFYSPSMEANVKIPYVNDKAGPYVPVVGQDLFIIGYPLTFAKGGDFPIWKRGSIATEPSQSYRELQAYLIDAVTREGLSGSPVIGNFVNPSFDNGGKGVLTLMGTERAFAGLYTGRIGNRDDFSAQMGLVWQPSIIDQIIEENWT
jgi:hypothetical protein